MGESDDKETLLDLVYEAAVDPGLLPLMLERFTEALGGRGAAFRSYELYGETGTVLAVKLDSAVLDDHFRRLADRNPLKSSREFLLQLKRSGYKDDYSPGTKMDVEWLPKSDFVRTEYYNDFYRTLDIHSDISVGLDAVRGGWTGIDVYRSQRQGAFTTDELTICSAIHPHMVRALHLGRRLAARQGVSEGLAEVFDTSPHGMALLDRDGRLLHLNGAGERLVSQDVGLKVIDGRLACAAQDAARRLQQLIGVAAAAEGDRRKGGSMAIAWPGRLRPLSVIVAPVRARQTWSLFDGPAVMVCITDLEAGTQVSEVMLQELFGLTPAEVRVAVSLFAGLEPGQAADRLGVSITTVRTHLARIYSKTGTAGQSDLSRLLARLATAEQS